MSRTLCKAIITFSAIGGSLMLGLAATIDGSGHGAVSQVRRAVVGKLVEGAIPIRLAEDGTVTFVHCETKAGAEAIAESGLVRAGGADFGSAKRNAFGLPQPMPGYAEETCVRVEEAIVRAPASNATQNGLLRHAGAVLLK